MKKTNRDPGNMPCFSSTVYSSTQLAYQALGEAKFKQLHTCLTLALELLETMFFTYPNEEKKEWESLVNNVRNILGLINQFKENHHVENDCRKNEIGKICPKRNKLQKNLKFLRKLNQVMEENFPDPDFNVEQLAKKLYISESTLNRKIRSLIGKAPCEFICSYRLEKAVQLLKKPLALVTDVAYEVGFNSRTYFTKCFKDTFHLSPSEFQSFDGKTIIN